MKYENIRCGGKEMLSDGELCFYTRAGVSE